MGMRDDLARVIFNERQDETGNTEAYLIADAVLASGLVAPADEWRAVHTCGHEPHDLDCYTAVVGDKNSADIVNRLAAQVAAVRALHRPWYEINGVRHDMTVSVGNDEVPEGHICRVGGWESCNPDYEEHFVLACVECRQTTDDAEPGRLFWPCPTVAALAADQAPTTSEEADRG